MKQLKGSECVDRLSELPDSLILVILSSLRMRDVVRTTLVSKRWKNLWTTIPCIDFSDEYRNFICGALAQWKGAKILKFLLTCDPNNFVTCQSSDVESWLRFAIEKQVEELSVNFSKFRTCTRFIKHSAPQSLYSCSSITALTLNFCSLEIEVNVEWNQLKSLTLEYRSTLSADAMSKILLGAPQLEELILGIYQISGNFNIRSRSLKMLQIGHDWSKCETVVTQDGVLRIWAPNLLTLQISTVFFYDARCFLDVPSLTNAHLSLVHFGGETAKFETISQVFQSLCHVEKVTLCKWCIKILLKMKKNHIVVPFSNAKFLILHNVNYDKEKRELVEMMFPKLESLSRL